MRLSAFSLILFFVSLNLSLWLINETQVLPAVGQSPYEEPSDIKSYFAYTNISGTSLLLAGITFTISFVVGKIMGNLIYGTTIAVILIAFELVFPLATWILFGFPAFIRQIGGNSIQIQAVATVLEVLMCVVWFWFILGLVATRDMRK